MISKKIKGFSLMEVLFNLILISIVISCGYLGYNYAFNDLNLFNKVNTEISEFVQFNNAFVIDQSKCSIIERESELLKLKSDSSGNVIYTFNKNNVTRTKNDLTDTFHLKTLSINCLYDKKETERGIIEEGNFTLECAGKKMFSSFSKKYDSYQLQKADSINASHGDQVR
ncbi:MAG: hypothetical protein IAF38_16945 [Bacteroidia bacterium]|nr:hypothetical protein [Bacteroidia bacterium]